MKEEISIFILKNPYNSNKNLYKIKPINIYTDRIEICKIKSSIQKRKKIRCPCSLCERIEFELNKYV